MVWLQQTIYHFLSIFSAPDLLKIFSDAKERFVSYGQVRFIKLDPIGEVMSLEEVPLPLIKKFFGLFSLGFWISVR
jgi:hypothetical protein